MPYVNTPALLPLASGASIHPGMQQALRAQDKHNSDVAQAFSSLTSSVTALQAVPSDVLNVKSYGVTGDGVTDDTAAMQTAINAAYGHILYVPRGRYRIASGPLIIQPIYGSSGQLPITIQGEGADGNGGPTSSSAGTYFSIEGASDGFQLINTVGSTNVRLILQDFGIYGDGTNAAGGNGISYQQASGFTARRLWIQNMRGHGIQATKAWSSLIEDCVINQNRLNGIYVHQQFNNGVIRRCTVLNNGRVYSQQLANIFMDGGATFESLGAVIEATDVSYAGNKAFSLFKFSDTTLTSIAVATNVATATTAAAHGLLVGQKFTINGASTAGLDAVYPYTVATVPTGTTFTFTTTGVADSPPGSPYNNGTDPFLSLGPSSFGLAVKDVRGLQVLGMYAEDTNDNTIYLGANIVGVQITGGYQQGQYLVADGPSLSGGRIGGVYFAPGQRNASGNNGLYNNNQVDFDVQANNSFAANSKFTQGTLQKRDGRYIGTGAPSNSYGASGDYYFRTDTPGVANQRLYINNAGAWAGIV